MWDIQTTSRFEKQLRKLPESVKTKFKKQMRFMTSNFNHPSLHTKKKEGGGEWEARVDYHYRFTFIIDANTMTLLTIGMHDEGLGK